MRPDDLAARVIGAAVERNGIDGSRSTTSSSAAPTRRARTTATSRGWARCWPGLPVEVPGVTVNRLCASGPRGGHPGARARSRLGDGDIVLAGGVESMTRSPFVMLKPDRGFPRGNAASWSTRRSAGASSTRGWRSTTRPSRWARRPRTSPSATASRARTRTRSRSSRTGARSPRRRRARSTTRSSPVDVPAAEGRRR